MKIMKKKNFMPFMFFMVKENNFSFLCESAVRFELFVRQEYRIISLGIIFSEMHGGLYSN